MPLIGRSNVSSSAGAPPFQLVVSSRPPVLAADNGTYQDIVLEFVNSSSHLPVIPSKNVTVYLTSSNIAVGNVSSSVVFPAGDIFYTANFTTTDSPGTTTITAVSNNTMPSASGQAVITTQTVGGVPYQLAVYLSPDSLPASSGLTSDVVVQAQDSNGNPVVLTTATKIALSSSDSGVGSTPTILTIPAGSNFATVNFTVASNTGITNITAHTDGMQPGVATMQTFTTGQAPTGLSVQIAPPTIIANGNEYTNLVTVQVINAANGEPTIAPSNILINVTTSSLTSGKLHSEMLNMSSGSAYVQVGFNSTNIPGTVLVAASAPGYVTGNATFNLVSSTEGTRLALYTFPSSVLAGGQTYHNLIAVQLQDSAGNPAKAYNNVLVELGTSTTTTGNVSSSITVPAGQTFALASFTTTNQSGSVNVTAIASGYSSAEGSFSTIFLPTEVNVNNTAPFNLPLGDNVSFNVSVTSEGAPLLGASVALSLNGGSSMGNVSNPTTTNSNGIATVSYTAGTVLGAMPLSLQVSDPGYQPISESLNVTVYNSTMTALLVPSLSKIPTDSTDNLTLTVTMGGSPLANASVQWSASNGTLFNASTLTNSNGTATAQYQSGPAASNVEVQAEVTKVGYTNTYLANATISVFIPTFTVQNTVNPASVEAGQKFGMLIYVEALGEPAAGARLIWNSSTATIVSADALTGASGFANATFVAGPENGSETIQVQITENGIQTYLDNVTLNAYLNNMTLSAIDFRGSIVTGYSTTFYILVTSNGDPVSNASLSWKAGSGSFSQAILTNKTGYAALTYTSGSSPENVSITVSVSKQGYVQTTKTMYLDVVQKAPAPPSPSKNPLFIKVGNLLPLWIVIVIIAGGAGAGFFVFRRIRNRGNYEEEGEEEEE